jgi:hypothetical protein
MLKKRVVGKKKRRGIRITTGRLSFATPRYKDPCYGPLTKESQERAAEANRMGTLDLMDGMLRCECGKMVGAKRATMGSYFEPDSRGSRKLSIYSVNFVSQLCPQVGRVLFPAASLHFSPPFGGEEF